MGPATIRCPICGGADPDCPECGGLDRVEIQGCPRQRVCPEHEAAVRAALQLERGVLPAAGAWTDQSSTFVAAAGLLENEIGHWRAIAAKHAAKE